MPFSFGKQLALLAPKRVRCYFNGDMFSCTEHPCILHPGSYKTSQSLPQWCISSTDLLRLAASFDYP